MPVVSGTVKDAMGAFARRLVRVHRRDTGALVGETLSHPTTGAWSVTTADYSKHYAVAHDSDARITYLPFNGDNGSTSFPEWGGKAVTAYGNAQISTAQSKFGGSSAYFDGNGDYLTLASNECFSFGSGDFTIEGFFYETASGPIKQLVGRHSTTADTDSAFLLMSNSQKLTFSAYVGGANYTVSNAATHTLNEWHHFAATRSGTTIYLFLDGALVSTVDIGTNSINNVSQPLALGAIMSAGVPNPGGYYYSGYIDDPRISKGVAHYIANFTPPTAPHGDALSQMANAMVFDFLTPA